MSSAPQLPPLSTPITRLLRVPPGPVDLDAYDPAGTPGVDEDDRDRVESGMDDLGQALSDLQERLYANGRVHQGSAPRVLLVLQGLDTSGKGGVIRHALGLMDPQGIHLAAFKKPTVEELAHDFLWRIEREVPAPGLIGVFDRSHYEDVVVARVSALAAPEEIERRYGAINQFETRLAAAGVVIIKCFLNVSYEKQGERLSERLDRPDKHWKYNPGDLDTRRQWADHRAAYETALERCNTPVAPWYVVPADRKWYRNWAVARLLAEALDSLALAWPAADFDVAAERRRLASLG